MPDEKGISPAALAALAKGDLLNALIASTPGGIEAQEARGQRDLVANEWLPISDSDTKRILEEWGVVFGEPVDDLFIRATLPAGWRKVALDHSMWSQLLDVSGRIRARIFYKAAFYDRRASISLMPRYTIGQRYYNADKKEVFEYDKEHYSTYTVLDYGKIIFESKLVCPITASQDYFKADDEAGDEVRLWLSAKYPNWKNPAAYWEEG